MSFTQGIKTWIIALVISIKVEKISALHPPALSELSCVKFSGVTEGDHIDRTNIVHFIQHRKMNVCCRVSAVILWRKEMQKKKKIEVVSRFVCLDRRHCVCPSELSRWRQHADWKMQNPDALLSPHLLSYADISVRSFGLYIILTNVFRVFSWRAYPEDDFI